MSVTKAYEEVVNFIASGSSPDEVIAFRPSEEARARVYDLVGREKTSGLNTEETAELDRLLERQALQLAGRYPTGAAQKRTDADDAP